MKRIQFSLLTIGCLLATLCFVACQPKGSATVAEAIEYDSISIEKKIPLIEPNDTTLPFADFKINMLYPVKFGNAEQLERLQQVFLGTFFNDKVYDSMSPRQAANTYTQKYEEWYQQMKTEFEADKARMNGEVPQWYWYSRSLKNELVYQKENLLVYAVMVEDYQGGAHGSWQVTYFNIDLDDQVTISEQDLFGADYQPKLKEVIIQQLMADNGVSTPEGLIEQGFFPTEELQLNNNFWINDKGIHYLFNQYEIAPYAMGPIEVTLPYDSIKHLLTEDNIVSKLFLNK